MEELPIHLPCPVRGHVHQGGWWRGCRRKLDREQHTKVIEQVRAGLPPAPPPPPPPVRDLNGGRSQGVAGGVGKLWEGQ
jgi:hypothetical protein